MTRLWLKLVCFYLWSVTLAAAVYDDAEPDNFDPIEALVQKGIDRKLLQQRDVFTRQDSPYPTCPFMCQALAMSFENQTYLRGSESYEAFKKSYWSNQQASVEPQCVFAPQSTEQLSIGILLLRVAFCPFAAKSGGHAAFASASSIQDGVSISLAAFNQIKVAEDRKTVDVGPGNKWQAVYEAVEKVGLAVLGGRDGDIGVGGLSTGGGISLFSSEFGLVCDNVVSYEVVTAWGAVLNVSATSHPDLYWALRGGGNNFGLVTNFKFEAIEQGNIWGGPIGWGEDAFAPAIQAYYDLGHNSPYDPKAAAILSFSATGSQLGNIAQTLLSYSLPQPVPAILSDLATIPNPLYNNTFVRSISNYSTNFASWPAGTRDEIWTHTSILDVDFMTFVKDTLFDIGPRIQAQTTNLRVSCSFQALTKGMLDNTRKNGGNPLGLSNITAPLLMLSQAWIWENETDDEVVWSGIREFQTKVESRANDTGLNVDYRYMNYANVYQDVIASYGQENKQRLNAIALKYDPARVYQTLQPGYFKLEGAPIQKLGTPYPPT